MSQERDVTRLFRSWIREDQHESADQVLGAVLDRLDTTPQLRSWWPARRSNRMNGFAKLLAAAAAVLLVAVVGYQFLPAQGGVGGEPTIAPSPSPSLLARGTFTAQGITAELDATGSGEDVAGTMALSDRSDPDNRATVDLEWSRTTAEGLIQIGGLLTESTWDPNAQDWNDGFPTGQRVAVTFEPGSPVKAIWFVTFPEDGVASCAGLFESMDSGDEILPGQPGLDAISGTVEFGP